jgi:multiple antibiotic resistance protein
MVFPSANQPLQEEIAGEPFIVPLAIPYVAGPSTLATEMLMMSREPDRWPEWLLALVAAWSVCGVAIFFGSRIRRLIGERGLIASERLMGMLLVALSMQMLLNGIRIAIADKAA